MQKISSVSPLNLLRHVKVYFNKALVKPPRSALSSNHVEHCSLLYRFFEAELAELLPSHFFSRAVYETLIVPNPNCGSDLQELTVFFQKAMAPLDMNMLVRKGRQEAVDLSTVPRSTLQT